MAEVLPAPLTASSGIAVWRVQLFVMIPGPVWMILAATRVLRGSEDARPAWVVRITGLLAG